MTIKIPLHGKKAAGRVALIDDEDYELVSQYNWYIWEGKLTSYALTNVKRDGKHTTILMHRLITSYPRTDHKNGNGLDNCRENLRAATHAQNMANMGSRGRSAFRGVHWHRPSRKWIAKAMKDGQRYYLGCFDSEEAAARAYDKKAQEIHGEFARLNFGKDANESACSAVTLSHL